MKRWLITTLAAASIFIAVRPARSEIANTDVRCLAVSKMFASIEKDPAKKQIVVASVFFYLGRIDATLSPNQLKAQATDPGGGIKKTELGDLMTFCARKMISSQQVLLNMGRPPASTFPRK